MAIAEIRLSDGRIAEVRVPDGATEDQVRAFVQQNLSQIQQPVQDSSISSAPENNVATLQSRLDEIQSLPVLAGSPEEQEVARLQSMISGLTPEPEDPSFTDRLIGRQEAAFSALAGGPAALTGQLVGSVEGAGRELLTGQTGSGLAEDIAEMRSEQFAAPFMPRTEEGQRQTEALGEFLEPLASLPPFVPQGQALAALSPAARQAVIANTKKIIDNSALPSLRASEMGFKSGDLSAGAAQTSRELERAATSRNMLVPFEGQSALTRGQATRNFEQLQFEKEVAKQGNLGLPLRERVENQTNTLIANLDALADQPSPARTELRDIGFSVDEALNNRFEAQRRRVNRLYDQARDAGQLREPIEIDRIGLILEDIQRFEDLSGVGGLVKGARSYAVKNGLVDADGNPLTVSLDDAELFRQWVNDATDLTDARQSRVRRILISAIDDATEGAGGDVYRRARRARAEMAREFENVGITRRLLSTKRGTDERSVAYEDVFKKVFLDSPIEEINKLRGTLLKSGDEGKQAWADMKAKGIEYIKESAQSASQRDSRGNPILSPDRLNRVILQLDQKGKLDSIYGKRNAQMIRDLGDLANDIYTAPPGAINYSGTASALMVALDGLAGFAVTGVPAPVATTLKEGSKYIRDAKTRRRINASLNYLENLEKDR